MPLSEPIRFIVRTSSVGGSGAVGVRCGVSESEMVVVRKKTTLKNSKHRDRKACSFLTPSQVRWDCLDQYFSPFAPPIRRF